MPLPEPERSLVSVFYLLFWITSGVKSQHSSLLMCGPESMHELRVKTEWNGSKLSSIPLVYNFGRSDFKSNGSVKVVPTNLWSYFLTGTVPIFESDTDQGEGTRERKKSSAESDGWNKSVAEKSGWEEAQGHFEWKGWVWLKSDHSASSWWFCVL